MSRIVAINGSPKAADSVSGKLIQKMEGFLNTSIETCQAVKVLRQENPADTVAGLLQADALLVVFPLYVDGLPAPLVGLLSLLEQAAKVSDSPRPVVYAVCNCGFYEAEHTALALRMVRAFAARAGMGYGYGVGIGCGGALGFTEKGPAENVYAVLRGLAGAIGGPGVGERADVMIVPKMPRFLYKAAGHLGWRQMAKQNGVRGQLFARPHGK